MGAAAFSSALLVISYKYNLQITATIIVVFLISGLLASSRLVLKEHKPSQVYMGLIIGFLSGFFGLFLL